MLTLLDPRLWLVGIGAMAITYGGGRYQQYSHDKAAYAAKATAAALSATQAQEKAVENARAEEQRRTSAQTEIADAAKKDADSARADAANASDAAGRLQQRVDELLAAARAAHNSATTGSGTPAGEPLGVLADVLSSADKRAGILADYADQARIAGLACERAYEALTPVIPAQAEAGKP